MKFTSLARRSVAVVAAVAVVALSPAPARSAGAANAVFDGSGTTSPTLTDKPTNIEWTVTGNLTGTFVAGSTVTTGSMRCTFNFSTVAETIARGDGGGISSCSGTSVAGYMSKHCSYITSRKGTVLTTSGLCTVSIGSARARVAEHGEYVFTPVGLGASVTELSPGFTLQGLHQMAAA
jgi:hypothetical protein